MISTHKFYKALDEVKERILSRYANDCRNHLSYVGDSSKQYFKGRVDVYDEIYHLITNKFSDENICGDEDE